MQTSGLKKEFRNLLRQSGWSQAEAARQLAMTPSAISQMVRDNSAVRPSPVTLRLFHLLLLREQPHTPALAPGRKSGGNASAWEQDLIRDLRRIPPSKRESILAAVRVMVAAAGNTARNARRQG